jgi:hypothetical protein
MNFVVPWSKNKEHSWLTTPVINQNSSILSPAVSCIRWTSFIWIMVYMYLVGIEISIGVRVGFSNMTSTLSFWPANDVPVHEKGADIYGYDLSSIAAYSQVGMMSQALVKAKSWRDWIKCQNAEHETPHAYTISTLSTVPPSQYILHAAPITVRQHRWRAKPGGKHQGYRVVFCWGVVRDCEL